jgi:hypothetical protein
MQCNKDFQLRPASISNLETSEVHMSQLAYSRKVVPAQESELLQLLKEAFNATPLGMFIAAARSAR